MQGLSFNVCIIQNGLVFSELEWIFLYNDNVRECCYTIENKLVFYYIKVPSISMYTAKIPYIPRYSISHLFKKKLKKEYEKYQWTEIFVEPRFIINVFFTYSDVLNETTCLDDGDFSFKCCCFSLNICNKTVLWGIGISYMHLLAAKTCCKIQ